MPVTAESRENINRGIINDRFFGIQDLATGNIHLAIGARGDGVAIPDGRRSNILGTARPVIPGAGGHSVLCNWAGVVATQQAQGVATGNACGFMLEITGSGFTLTLRSGLNGQFGGVRPGATRLADRLRTLPQTMATMLQNELDALGRTIALNFGDI